MTERRANYLFKELRNMANFEKAIIGTFKAEGGFQNDPADNANYVNGVLIGTNKGISAQGYYSYFKKVPTVSDMKALTEDQAKLIFKGNYWDKIGGDYIVNQSVAELMFQYIIGGGPEHISVIKELANKVACQKVLVENDLPITKSDTVFINFINQASFHAEMIKWRMGHYDRVVKANPAKLKFLKGWQNRLAKHVYKP